MTLQSRTDSRTQSRTRYETEVETEYATGSTSGSGTDMEGEREREVEVRASTHQVAESLPDLLTCRAAMRGPVRPCGCSPAVTVDETRHAAWHQLVIAQGGPAGTVNARTLQDARSRLADR